MNESAQDLEMCVSDMRDNFTTGITLLVKLSRELRAIEEERSMNPILSTYLAAAHSVFEDLGEQLNELADGVQGKHLVPR